MQLSGVADLLDRQAGVVNRAQLVAAGHQDHDLRRLVRRRLLVRSLPGVFVTHTGAPTWSQRAWAAVLWAEPAALCGASALRAADGSGRRLPDDGRPIHVAIDHRRTLKAPPGVVVHRKVALDRQVSWTASPPRQRIEEAAIDVATARADRLDAVAVLAEVVGSRLTTAERLAATIAARPRVADRAYLAAVLRDVQDGTCSVLEHGYLALVERPHALPTAHRQLRDSSKGTLYRDACYEDAGVIVELDGRVHHSRAGDRDRDLDRDLDAAVTGRVTIRLGWGQVYRRPCATAERIGAVLAARGWRGPLRRCPSCGRAAV